MRDAQVLDGNEPFIKGSCCLFVLCWQHVEGPRCTTREPHRQLSLREFFQVRDGMGGGQERICEIDRSWKMLPAQGERGSTPETQKVGSPELSVVKVDAATILVSSFFSITLFGFCNIFEILQVCNPLFETLRTRYFRFQNLSEFREVILCQLCML